MSAPHYSVIRVNGADTAYFEIGDRSAPPLLLLHDGAWGGSGVVSWARIAPDLADRFRVIVPDMLGFGHTSKIIQLDSSPYDFRIRHLLAFLDSLGIDEPVHIVGTSFGGSVGLNMLSEYSTRVASLVSVSGTGGPWRSKFGIRILSHWDGTEECLRGIVDTLAEATEDFDPATHVIERLETASIAGHYRSMMAPGVALPDVLKRPNPAAANWPNQIAGAETPVLLVQGLRDELVESNWTEHLTKALPHARVETLDTRHSPNLSHPNEFVALLTDWFDSLPTRGQ